MKVRIAPDEYLRLHLQAHELLRDVPLYDVSIIDLPGGGDGRTIADVQSIDNAAPPSRLVKLIYGTRHVVGRMFGWDTPMRVQDSIVSRLPDRIRLDSEVPPGTADGAFLVIYQLPHEALRETINATVHGFICTALAPIAGGYRFYYAVYVLPVSWFTRPYLIAIAPFRRVLYPAMLRRIRKAWRRTYAGGAA